MEKRDLAADMEMCDKATPEPWERDTDYIFAQGKIPVCTMEDLDWRDNAQFIATARTALPHAIRRALAAEARVLVLEEALREFKSWWDRVYPDSVFTGLSGDEGALEVVRLRELLRQALEGGTPDDLPTQG